ncbi:hypothetical protein MUN81_00960 [Hymenobacter sp. 5317J-9]|uniref:hypothetical protein n=1 Tax=Hymenobacter sp. 5317J-9 TaxID=2932250 RepID=UPI001FD660E4|nr:hypothetical protein [Hymenobacter sp. 5317J-9]UOQ98076.1 hypothetical protein MUN81_00960 [Hymenobacter sp. 5317J-9]
MKFDKSLLRTILFAVGVVALVIGIYQTIYYNDLGRNYWIFMVSTVCWMPLLYWRQQERVAAKIAEQEAKLARQNRAKTPAKSTKKRR